MNPKLSVPAIVVLAVVVIAGAAVLAGGGGDDGDTAVASPTAVVTATVPGTSPAPEDSPTVEPSATAVLPDNVPDAVRDFALERSTGILEFFEGSSAEVPEGTGVYVFDIETKEVEGWHEIGGDLYRGLSFFVAPDNRLARIDVPGPAGPQRTIEAWLLADRETETVFALPEGANAVAFPTGELVAAGSRVLVRFAAPEDEPGGGAWFVVVDVAAAEPVVASFQANAWSGLISPDGERVLLIGEALTIIDIATSEDVGIAWMAEVDWPPVTQFCRDYLEELRERAGIAAEVVQFEIRNTLQGEAFLVMANSGCPEADGPVAWLHYTWEGDLMASGRFRIQPAPDGEIAWLEPPMHPTTAGLPIAQAVDLRDGLPAYRVVGASAGEAPPVVLMPRQGGERDWSAATVESGIQPLDATGSVSVAPAPGDTGVYARRYFDISLIAFDAAGNELGGYAPEPGDSFQGVNYGMAPWGDVPTEMRFVAGPRGSDDCCPAWSLIVPYVEEPPFEGDPIVRLREDAVGSEIRDAPAGDNVVGTLTVPEARVVGTAELVEPSADQLHCEFLARYADFAPDCGQGGIDFARYSGLWLNVVSEDGVNGWILVRAGTVGL